MNRLDLIGAQRFYGWQTVANRRPGERRFYGHAGSPALSPSTGLQLNVTHHV